MVSLHYQELGEGEPVILLHGLLGMSDNLGSLARTLAKKYRVIVADAINHGHSPHASYMDYPSMSQDVQALMAQLNIDKAAILGHSMGGKTAMQIAADAAEKLHCLIVADIAPIEYPPREHPELFAAMKQVETAPVQSRRDADKVLQEHGVETLFVRQFLLKNLYKNEQEQWVWRCGLDNLINNYLAICQAPDMHKAYQGPSLFIRGERSDYIQSKDIALIDQHFPQATYAFIEGAGHWLHAEKPELFANYVLEFLQKHV